MSSLVSRHLRQTFRLSRSTPLVRNFAASGSVMNDIVKELYVQQLKSYKPTKLVSGPEDQIKALHLSDTPKPPKVDEDISSELAAYENEDLSPPSEKTVLAESLEKKLFAEETEETAHAH